MTNFIVSEWFAKREQLNIQTLNVEGIEFEIMTLSDSHKDDVKSCVNYEEMLSLAANAGISCNRKRVIEDKELAKDIDLLWSLEMLDIDCDPCIKYRVGEKICEISGLLSHLNEMLDSEEAHKRSLIEINGDNLPDTSLSLGQLEEDAAAAIAVV